MKKAVIITATVFVISFIVVVVSGAALGANGFKQLKNDEKIYAFLDKLSSFEDRIENIGDMFEERYDDDDYNINELLYEECIENEFTEETAVIGCQAATITVLPSNDERLVAEMKVYANKKNAVSGDFSLEADYEDYNVYVKTNVQHINSSAKLVIYVPKSVCNIKINSDIGDVKIQNFTLKNISIKIDVGEVDIENTTVEVCDINVNIGEVELENGFFANKLTVVTDTGDIKYELPRKSGAVISYTTDLGTLDIGKINKAAYKLYDKQGSEVDLPKNDGKIEILSESSVNPSIIQFKVSTGKIELEQSEY